MVTGKCKKGQTDDDFVVHRPASGIQYNPERLILILYSSVQLCAMMQIYSTKYIKRNESAM